MRILFVTAAWPTHYTSMVPLAWAFHSAGHDVRVCAQPAVTPTVRGSGLAAVAAGRDFDFAGMHRSKAAGRADGREYGGKNAIVDMFHEVAELMVDDVVAFARAWKPDLIVRDPVAFAASVAAQVVGAPLVRHAWGPDVFGTDQGAFLAAEMRDRLAPTYARFGVEVPEQFESVVVDPTPLRMRLASPQRCVPVRYLPYNGSGGVPQWALSAADKPRVCVTWGTFTSTAAEEHATFLVPEVVRALRDLDVEVVVTVTAADRERVPSGDPAVRVVESLPIHALLPSCAAVVHHGGANTTLTAASEAVPQVMVPQMFEQQLNTRLLTATGAGRAVAVPAGAGGDATTSAIRAGVAEVLADDGYRAAARRLRDEMLAEPSPTEVVEHLLSL